MPSGRGERPTTALLGACLCCLGMLIVAFGLGRAR